ncbi:hypothetical protein Peur_051291 [Populus x canadensis]
MGKAFVEAKAQSTSIPDGKTKMACQAVPTKGINLAVLMCCSILKGPHSMSPTAIRGKAYPDFMPLQQLLSCLGHDQILVLRRGGHYQDKNAPAGVKMKQLVQVVRTDIL